MQSAPSQFVSASDCVKIWNANAEQLSVLDPRATGSNFKDIAWNYKNTRLAGATNGDGIILYDLESGRKSGCEIPNSKEQTSVCFGSRSAELYSGGATGDVNLWNCDTGELLKTFDGFHKFPIRRLVKLRNGNIASACTSGEIIIWHTDSGTAQSRLKTLKSKSVRGLEHSKYDRSMLCTTSDDGIVCVWDTEKQIVRHVFAQHDAPAMDLSFSTINSLLLASCGLDKKVVFYDVHGNNVVKTYTCSQPVTAICFLSNGMHVCAGTSVGNIVLYDLRQDTKPLNTIQAHSASVQRLVLHSLKETKRSSKIQQRSSTSHSKVSRSKVEQKHVSGVAVERDPRSRTSRDLAAIGQLSSKVSNTEQSPNQFKANGDNTTRNLSNMEGFQAPHYDHTGDSSGHDTFGSFCEGIFSPVGNVNGSMQRDAVISQSTSKVQRASKGNSHSKLVKPINFETPVRNNIDRIPRGGNCANGMKTPEFGKGDFTLGSIVAEIKPSGSKTPLHISSPVLSNPTANSASSLGPKNKATGFSRKSSRHINDALLDSSMNGNHMADHSVAEILSHPTFTPLPANPLQYHQEFLKNTVSEVFENHEDNMRHEFRHLHVQAVKMFAELHDRMTHLTEQCSVNPLLLQEIERLRDENDRLRRKF